LLGPRADAAGTVWSRRRLGVKLDGAASAGEASAGPGWAAVGDTLGCPVITGWVDE